VSSQFLFAINSYFYIIFKKIFLFFSYFLIILLLYATWYGEKETVLIVLRTMLLQQVDLVILVVEVETKPKIVGFSFVVKIIL